MQQLTHAYLRFVRFKDVTQWYVGYYLNNNVINSKYQLTPIRNIITPKKNLIKKDDYDGILPIVEKIVFKTGQVIFREENKTGMNLYRLDQNDLLVSNINFHQGATALNTYGNIVASTHYQPYKINEKLVIPEYLTKVLRTPAFLSVVTRKKAQGIKNESGYNFIASLKIPLPSILVQQILINEYNNKIQQAEALEKQVVQIENDVENYLLTELGIRQEHKGYKLTESAVDIASEPQVEYVISNHQNAEMSDAYHWGDEIKKEYKCLKFVRFKDVTEWGYDRLIGNNRALLHSTIFPNKTLATLLEVNPRTSFSNLYDNDEISFIPMECISDEYGEWKEKRICKIASSKGYTKFMSGDLIWARITPCMQNGKSAIVDDLKNGYGCGSTEFHVLRNNNKQLNIHYVHSLLRMPIVLEDAMKSFTGSAGQQRVPKSYLENLTIPVPSLDVQNEIVEHINEQKEQIKQMKHQAEKLRKEALEDFEKEIFE